MSAWQEYKKNLGSTRPWDVINPSTPKANEHLAERRFSICEECPELIKLTSQCKKCGCFMKFKVKLQEAACPLGKW